MTSSPSILIAEDDPAIREGLTDSLSSEGYDVRSAPDGTQALAALQEQPADLLLLDIMMPGLSGYDVCRQLRSDGNQIPVLMLTAKGEEIDKVLGLELGAEFPQSLMVVFVAEIDRERLTDTFPENPVLRKTA